MPLRGTANGTVTNMKSLVVDQLGSLDDLRVQETESRALRDGQIRVKVAACGLNFVDSLMIEGKIGRAHV